MNDVAMPIDASILLRLTLRPTTYVGNRLRVVVAYSIPVIMPNAPLTQQYAVVGIGTQLTLSQFDRRIVRAVGTDDIG